MSNFEKKKEIVNEFLSILRKIKNLEINYNHYEWKWLNKMECMLNYFWFIVILFVSLNIIQRLDKYQAIFNYKTL